MSLFCYRSRRASIEYRYQVNFNNVSAYSIDIIFFRHQPCCKKEMSLFTYAHMLLLSLLFVAVV